MKLTFTLLLATGITLLSLTCGLIYGTIDRTAHEANERVQYVQGLEPCNPYKQKTIGACQR